MKLSDLKHSGHAPSLFCAFLPGSPAAKPKVMTPEEYRAQVRKDEDIGYRILLGQAPQCRRVRAGKGPDGNARRRRAVLMRR